MTPNEVGVSAPFPLKKNSWLNTAADGVDHRVSARRAAVKPCACGAPLCGCGA